MATEDWDSVHYLCTKIASAGAREVLGGITRGGGGGSGGMTSSARRKLQQRARGGLVKGAGLAVTTDGRHGGDGLPGTSSSLASPSSTRPEAPPLSSLQCGSLNTRKGPGRASALRAMLCRCYLRASISAAQGVEGTSGGDGDDDSSSSFDDDSSSSSSSSCSENGMNSEVDLAESNDFRVKLRVEDESSASRDEGTDHKQDAAYTLSQVVLPSVGVLTGGGIDADDPLCDRCWCCAASTDTGGELLSLKKCSGCRRAMYCSELCQNKHWKEHKASCKEWAASRFRFAHAF